MSKRSCGTWPRGRRARTLRRVSGAARSCEAVDHGIRPDNPVRGVKRTPDGKRERFLTDAEYRALGDALRAADTWPPAVACIRFVALTGWRRGEATGLTWGEVDMERQSAVLAETKSGRSIRPLPKAALAILRAMEPHRREGSGPDALVFPPTHGATLAFPQYWRRLGMPADTSAHTLRHSFASVAASLGMSGLTIAALLGHRSGTVTEGYVHWADAVLIAAADNVAEEIARRMGHMALVSA
jgi:integrase